MKLLFVRHGDPDVPYDDLTETGKKEALLLVPRLSAPDVKTFYVSPLVRAQKTAAPTLEKMGREAITCDWLREFYAPVDRPDKKAAKSCWDWLPQDWTSDERFFSKDHWFENERMAAGHVKEEYDRVTGAFDELLTGLGYVRDGLTYRVERPNEETYVFFCHFGVTCVLLSRLLNISPMPLWQGFVSAPASVTTVVTEERRPGTASFRVTGFGDISHLYAAGEKPSFAARFCEMYGNGERID